MPKPRKPDAARKPPVPTDSHAEIEDWIRRVMPDLEGLGRDIVRRPGRWGSHGRAPCTVRNRQIEGASACR